MPAHPFSWTADDIPDQIGRIHLVTGASSGLGLEATRRLLDAEATVIAAVRNPDKARAALSGHPRADHVDIRRLDLADLNSVRAFAQGVGSDYSHLDVLVANAGLWTRTRELSAQNIELTLATNHFGHYALTGLLLPLLTQGRDQRVVTVTSNLYRRGKLEPALDDLAASKNWSQNSAYATSKTANLLFAVELDRQLRNRRSPVRSIAVHPGMASTPIHGHAPLVQRAVMTAAAQLASRPIAVGALPLLHGAASPDHQPGSLLGFGLFAHDTRLRYEKIRFPGDDRELAARLWRTSESETGVRIYPA